MNFFMDRYGDEYPVTEIIRIVRPQGEKELFKTRYQTVYLRSGEDVQVAEWMVNDITKAPIMIVPTAPGTFILGGVDPVDTAPSEVWQTPVIAFSIGSENDVTPWTVDGPNDGVSNPGPLLMANGMVIKPHERMLPLARRMVSKAEGRGAGRSVSRPRTGHRQLDRSPPPCPS